MLNERVGLGGRFADSTLIDAESENIKMVVGVGVAGAHGMSRRRIYGRWVSRKNAPICACTAFCFSRGKSPPTRDTASEEKFDLKRLRVQWNPYENYGAVLSRVTQLEYCFYYFLRFQNFGHYSSLRNLGHGPFFLLAPTGSHSSETKTAAATFEHAGTADPQEFRPEGSKSEHKQTQKKIFRGRMKGNQVFLIVHLALALSGFSAEDPGLSLGRLAPDRPKSASFCPDRFLPNGALFVRTGSSRARRKGCRFKHDLQRIQLKISPENHFSIQKPEPDLDQNGAPARLFVRTGPRFSAVKATFLSDQNLGFEAKIPIFVRHRG
ncbi:hypothetical protein B0H19DRAFT_1243303 [Mycena capillaripes]|nr:hypothetical protein B0H19DRAFT_1243303 [Mycena capillaripes]